MRPLIPCDVAVRQAYAYPRAPLPAVDPSIPSLLHTYDCIHTSSHEATSPVITQVRVFFERR